MPPRPPRPSEPQSADRRNQLLEEALRIVGEAGLGAVTHRKVESAAGVPHGTVTYWFGNRDGLLAALVEYLCDESERQIGAIAAGLEATLQAGEDPDVELVAAGLGAWFQSGATHHLARLELELQAGRDPQLAARMTAAAQIFWDMCAALVTLLGSTQPQRDGRALAAMVDGLLVDHLAHGGEAGAAQESLVAAMRWLLHGPPRLRAQP